MKIMKLRARNVNSLKGETEIDFETFLQGDAIFAITGETGAGKTTLLDIVTCALFGRTPRLKNPRDLMTRGTGECLCETVFEVKGRRLRASWTIHRAHRNPDGKFQQPKMELADEQSGNILATGVQDVPRKVEELSGLDFSRFTQSMMLAQGSFDAFLKADATKRSELLEQITDTGVYREISIAVYGKHKALNERIAMELKVLETIAVLPDTERKAKEADLAEISNKARNAGERYDMLQKSRTWHEKREAFETKFKETEAMLSKAQKEVSEHADSFAKLEKAKRALDLQSAYHNLKTAEKTYERSRDEVKRLKERAAELSKRCESLKRETKAAKERLKKTETFHAKASEKLQAARRLQTQLDEAEKQKTSLTADLIATNEEMETLRENLVETKERIAELETKAAKERSYLQTHAVDANLGEDLAASEKLIETLRRHRSLAAGYAKNFEDTSQRVEALRKQQAELEKRHALLAEEAERAKEAWEAHNEILQNAQADEATLRDEMRRLESLQRTMETRSEALKNLEKLGKEQKTLEGKIDTKKIEEKKLREHLESLDAHHRTLLDKERQEILLRGMEEHRRHLRDGEPCPLCGATDHPYVRDLPAVDLDATQKEIERVREKREKISEALERLLAELATLKGERDSLERESLNWRQKLENAETVIRKENISPDEEGEVILREKFEANQHALSGIEKLRRESNGLLAERDETAKRVLDINDKLAQAKGGLDRNMKEAERWKAQREAAEKEAQVASETIVTLWKPYAVSFDPDDIESSLDKLTARKKAYEAAKKMLEDLEETIQEAKRKEAKETSRLETLQESADRQSMQERELDKLIESLKNERWKALPLVGLDRYEARVKRCLETIRQEYEHLRREFEADEKLLAKTQRDLEEKSTKEKRGLEIWRNEQRAFNVALEKHGFENREAFLEAWMEEEERKSLQDRLDTLMSAMKRAETLHESAKKQLEEHLQNAKKHGDTPPSPETLRKAKEEADILLERKGRLAQELESDSARRKKREEQERNIATQKKELEILAKLNEMIGAADGAKFSRFAQGITFDRLIHLANGHLHILTDRYEIVRDRSEGSGLELLVIDRYQGDALRSARTLSGGESFLVSLALALGLSELASRRIAIDSLFLDEGFGTLDGETLATALEALNRLEARGKMVGVISHVEALKEAIPRQIRIRKMGGGVSRVELR